MSEGRLVGYKTKIINMWDINTCIHYKLNTKFIIQGETKK